MTVRSNATARLRLDHSAHGYPYTIAGYFYFEGGGLGNGFAMAECVPSAEGLAGVFKSGTGLANYTQTTPGGLSDGFPGDSGEDYFTGGVPQPMMLTCTSATSHTLRTLDYPSGRTLDPQGAGANATELAAVIALVIGAWERNGTDGLYLDISVGEIAKWLAAGGDSHFADLVALTPAEDIGDSTFKAANVDVWELKPSGTAGSAAPTSYVGLKNGTVLSVAGTGLTISARAHPVTRTPAATLSGTATLDGLAASGSMAPQPNSSLSGTAALDGLAASGGMSQTPGTLTVPQLRAWTNTLLTSQLVANIAVLRIARPVVLLDVAQDITTHVTTGDLVHTSAALVPGTAVLVVGFNLDGSQRFARAVTIT